MGYGAAPPVRENFASNPRRILPTHLTAEGVPVETTVETPFPVAADLNTGGAVSVLMEVMTQMLQEQRATNFYLANMSGQRLSARDKETLP